jgi:S-adenosylmethionine hydrolase
VFITFLSDFGLQDDFVGTCHGVMKRIAPEAEILDITHGIPPQDVMAGALALEEACAFFPSGAVHVAVVDPGVGSARSAIALETDRAFYVGPDNGIFELVLKREKLKHAVKLENPAYRLPQVSSTFHGRDIFAPAAAHIACFVSLAELGPPCTKLTRPNLPQPQMRAAQLEIHVLRVDRFGNLMTDLTPEIFAQWNSKNTAIRIQIGSASFTDIVRATFADVAEGSPVAYFGSSGRLEIAVRNGNAAAFFGAGRGIAIVLEK